jgi:hypothetical protein
VHARREQDNPAGLPDRERGVDVAPEVELLHRDRLGGVLADQVGDLGVDRREPALERRAGPRLDHAAVEGHQGATTREHHAVSRVGGSGIDA